MTNKYRVKSIYYKGYSSERPVVKYKLQKRVMGFWSDMENNYETTDKEYVSKICEELNITGHQNGDASYVIHVQQTTDQLEDNQADLLILNQKTHVIKRLKDVPFTINKLKIGE